MEGDIRQKVLDNILRPKKDFHSFNNRTKKPRKSDSCVDRSDPDAHQGSAKESEREEED